MVIEIDASKITDWYSFHREFQTAMGFPESYRKNMNSWIECMSAIDTGEPGTTPQGIRPGDSLTIKLFNASSFRSRCPEQFTALLECSAFVNMKKEENGQNTIISIALY